MVLLFRTYSSDIFAFYKDKSTLFLERSINGDMAALHTEIHFLEEKHEKILCRHDGSRCRAIDGRF